MKKFLAVLLALAMVFALAACGSGQQTPESTAAASDNGASNIKVGFIFLHDENSTYDLNFMNGAKEAAAALGLSDDQVMMKAHIP